MLGTGIKIVAVIIITLGVVAGMICCYYGYTQYAKYKGFIQYATINGGANSYSGYNFSDLEEAGNKAYAGNTLMRYGGIVAIASFVGGLPLFWFGCLFKRVEEIQRMTYETKRRLEKLIATKDKE